MNNKIKNIISKIDLFLFKIFGSEKRLFLLENLKEAKKIFSYLNENENEKVRFVGGCVRKAICSENIDDIDLATALKPEEVKKKLTKNNVKVVDTGLSHGTITAFIKKKKFEITSLREDISTDGRHAEVAFTDDWEKDASRRDFTINSIYADIKGKIFDPFKGASDLKDGKIKFIGLPKDRIQEDYLRILRYFRFFAQYSKTDHNPNTIQSIKQNINGINKISNERIFDELMKILSLQNVQSIFDHKDSREILLNIFPQLKYYERLKNINKLNNKLRKMYNNEMVLASLILDETKDYEYFCYKYKTSNDLKNKFVNILKNYNSIKNKNFFSQDNIKKLIYFTNKKSVQDTLLFSIHLNKKTDLSNLEKLIDYVNTCKVPKFPISGEDLKKYGYETGKELGKKLQALEERWIKNNFVIDKDNLKKTLEKLS